MRIRLNGEEVDVQGPTIAALLEQRGIRSDTCAVEVNRELAPRRRHADITLREGDEVEIVTLVGGG